MHIIPDRLKELRSRKSWSRARLAKRTGLSERTIQRLEAKSRSQETTREETVRKLARAFGIDSISDCPIEERAERARHLALLPFVG